MRVHAVLLLGSAAACVARPLPAVGDTDATSAAVSGTTDGEASTSRTTEAAEESTASAGTTGAVVESTGYSATTDPSTGGPPKEDSTTAADLTTTGTGSDDSDASSSTSGVEYPNCFTEEWTVAIPEVPHVLAPAVVIDGPIFVAGNTADDEGWVGAWDQDGNELWSRTIDPAELGLDDAVGTVVDIDAFPNGDALLSYSHSGDQRSAVFARLDGPSGDVVWATAIGADELAEFDDGWGLGGGEAHAAAITESGRVFVVGFALLSAAYAVWLSEVDDSDGTLLGTSGLFNIDPVHSGISDFLADDDLGAYLSYSGGGGSYASGLVFRMSLSGEMVGSIGAGAENEICGRQAIDLDGNIGISCSWAEDYEFAPLEVIRCLERRTPDNTLLQGGFGEPPALWGQQVFEADGDVIITPGAWEEPAIYRLDDELTILSVDPIESSPSGVTALPDGDLIVGGWLDGSGLLRRYAGCEP